MELQKHLFTPNQRRPDGKCAFCNMVSGEHITELPGNDPNEMFSSGDSRDYEKFPHRGG